MKKNRNNNIFLQFAKKHIPLLVGLLMGLILPFLILLLVFTNGFHNFERVGDFSAWGSIVAGIATYLGAAVLGVISYYNTWVQDYKKKELDYSIELLNIVNDGYANFFNFEDIGIAKYFHFELNADHYSDYKNCRYKRFIINNYNASYPMRIEICKVEMVGETISTDCLVNANLFTSFNLMESIDYKTDSELFLGIQESLLPHWQANSEDEIYQGEFDTIKIIMKVSNKFNSEYILLSMRENDQELCTSILSTKDIKKQNFKDVSISQVLLKGSTQ